MNMESNTTVNNRFREIERTQAQTYGFSQSRNQIIQKDLIV